MALLVVKSAQMKCSMGASPAVLTVIRPNVTCEDKDVATVMDHAPNTNVPTFGPCKSTANPAVAAATSAAGGALTPAPCVPNTVSPWTPGCTKLEIGGQAALTDKCTLNCAWGGLIEVQSAGQSACEVP